MITCDICDRKIRNINNVPSSFMTKSIQDICGSCDRSLRTELHKVDIDTVKYREGKLKDVIAQLKLDKKDN